MSLFTVLSSGTSIICLRFTWTAELYLLPAQGSTWACQQCQENYLNWPFLPLPNHLILRYPCVWYQPNRQLGEKRTTSRISTPMQKNFDRKLVPTCRLFKWQKEQNIPRRQPIPQCIKRCVFFPFVKYTDKLSPARSPALTIRIYICMYIRVVQ